MPTNQPAGFHLIQTLRVGPTGVNKLAWSPNGQLLASTSRDGAIRLWDSSSGSLRLIQARRSRTNPWFMGGSSEEDPFRVIPSLSVTWSPSSLLLASSYGDKYI